MNKKRILGIFIALIIVMAMAILLLSAPIKMLKECEARGWDGSEYNTGVRKLKLFEESEDIIVKCNKAPEETDAMIDILDALPFVKIRNDVLEVEDE